MTDDRAIRNALAELTDGQPPTPPGRVAAVRRRAIRHRRRQAAAAVLTAAAVAAAIIGLVRLPGVLNAEPLSRPSWALQWPDHRNGSVPQSVLDRAVLAWMYSAPNIPPDGGNGTVPATGSSPEQVARLAGRYPVVWYVGQLIGHGQGVAVMFEVDGPNGRRLVVGLTAASEVMHDQAAWSQAASPWGFTVVPAPNPHRPPVAIGTYVAVQDPVTNGFDNWIVELADPDVRSMSWFAPTPSGVHWRTVRTSDGLAVANAGQLTGEVRLTGLTAGDGLKPVADVPVGVPGHPAVPTLATPTLNLPSSWAPIAYSSQGNETNEYSGFRATGRSYAVIAECYGLRPLGITINGHKIGTITCNDQQQHLNVPLSLLHRHTLWIAMSSSELTAWSVAFGSTR
jgi:hypothetical protein